MRILSSFILLGLLALPVLGETSGLESPSIAVSSKPSDFGYICAIDITDRESGRAIASPRLRLNSGEMTTLRIGSEAGKEALRVEAKVDSEAGLVLIRISSSKDDADSVIQETKIQLR